MDQEEKARLSTNYAWQTAGYSDRDLESIFASCPPEQALLLVHNKTAGSFDYSVRNQSLYYLNPILGFLRDVFDGGAVPEIKLLVSLHDSVNAELSAGNPVFGFCKGRLDNSTLLLPDPYYINNRGYTQSFEEMDRNLSIFRWEKKRPGAFWRGSSTGHPHLTKSDWRLNPRVRLCQISKEINDKNLIDASLAQIVQCESTEIEQIIIAEGLLDAWIPLEAFLTFKIQIDIDGNGCAWGLFQKLYMLSATLKIESPLVQWYYDKLIPWTHYIPVKADFSDLLKQLQWIKENDRDAREIAHSARQIVSELNYEAAVIYVRDLLCKLAQYRRE